MTVLKFIWDHGMPIALGVLLCYYWLSWRGISINWAAVVLGSAIGHILFNLYLKPLICL